MMAGWVDEHHELLVTTPALELRITEGPHGSVTVEARTVDGAELGVDLGPDRTDPSRQLVYVNPLAVVAVP